MRALGSAWCSNLNKLSIRSHTHAKIYQRCTLSRSSPRRRTQEHDPSYAKHSVELLMKTYNLAFKPDI